MQLELEFPQGPVPDRKGETLFARAVAEHVPATTGDNFAKQRKQMGGALIEGAFARENLILAFKKVKANKGAPGIDGISTEQLARYLKSNWDRIKDEIRTGRYKPLPVRRVEIPKPGGGIRLLGIPCVVDRFIQQAVLQILTPIFDPTFSASSFGFRPGRSAHDAVRQSKKFIQRGFRFVVDLDIEKFFDRVNHDMLMARIARRIDDKAVLKLIRRYLQSGAMLNGVCVIGEEGVPQGGPLSPLLANIILDDLDKELEKRGHCFSRYADDCNIYVRKKRSGDRVRASITEFLARKLKLKVNESKSAVDQPHNRKFLGFSFSKTGIRKIVFAPASLKKLKAKIREMTIPRSGISFSDRARSLSRYMTGWIGYYALAENPIVFRSIDQWMRRRLRLCQWMEWRLTRTKVRELKNLGLSERQAYVLVGIGKNSGHWRTAHTRLLGWAMSPAYFKKIGVPCLRDLYESVRQSWRTAVYGPVCTVV